MTNGNTRTSLIKGNGMDMEYDDPHSPTDSSEDSVEVRVEAITNRHKRKLAEPRRFNCGPLKKRLCVRTDNSVQPFRPWNESNNNNNESKRECGETEANGGGCEVRLSVVSGRSFEDETSGYFQPPVVPKACAEDEETRGFFKKALEVGAPGYFQPPVVALKLESHGEARVQHVSNDGAECFQAQVLYRKDAEAQDAVPLDLAKRVKEEPRSPRIPAHPRPDDTIERAEEMIHGALLAFPKLDDDGKHGDHQQRNYKNMTRERRIEANARERTRVHTISAAFETLRKSVPAYSDKQKLSKLSVLRIACSYIQTLESLLSDDTDVELLEDSIERVGGTIQREGKLRKKKDED